VTQRVTPGRWADKLKKLVMEHIRNTQSRFAEQLLNDWDRQLVKFWQVVPREYAAMLEREEAAELEKRA
jgi:glutamate synthase (NADPH) large chain